MFNIFTISLINENILISNLNNCNSLIELELYKLWFCSNFTFKLNNLQKLILYQCNNITFEENCFLKLKRIELTSCLINQTNYLLKLPQLEEFEESLCDSRLIFDFCKGLKNRASIPFHIILEEAHR